MNSSISKYLFYYPTTLLNGEFVYKYLQQYKTFQHKNRADIEAYQLYYLKKLVNHAYCTTAYYRTAFDCAGFKPEDLHSLEDMHRIPYIERNDVVSFKGEMRSSKKFLFISEKTTGGSTGEAVTLYKNSDALARERAATWRAYEWAGIHVGDPQARFWGVPLHTKQRLKYKLIDFVANRKRLSAFELNDERLAEYYQVITEYRPSYLYGYVSVIERFSEYLSVNNVCLPSCVKSVITTSEVLTQHTREKLESVFKIKVFNEYGCGEVGSIAHECKMGGMHIMEDNLIVEIKDPDKDGVGQVVVTDLFNYAMPIIRYNIGDFASLSVDVCECGLGLKNISNIHGRAYDSIYTPEGNSFHPEVVMYVFEDIKQKNGGIKQFQVIQEHLRSILVRIVKGEGFDLSLESFIKNEFHDRLSPSIDIRFEYVDSIEREKSGKLRLVKSQLKK